MKLRTLHIASLFFLASLLFAQVAVNFFHRNHDVHQNKSITVPLKAGEAGIQKHDEHCQVCAIDFFNHAFVLSIVLFFGVPKYKPNPVSQHVELELHDLRFYQGRAPPAF